MSFFSDIGQAFNRALNYKQWRGQQRAAGLYHEPFINDGEREFALKYREWQDSLNRNRS